MNKISISFMFCEVGHESVVHQTRSLCPLCEISSLRKEKETLINVIVLLREKIDAARNLCEKVSSISDFISTKNILAAISTDDN